MNKNKIAIIIPFFGKFNNYFELFLQSCKNNEFIDFYIFTDDTTEYQYPSNVILKITTLNEFSKFINSKFNFEISIKKAYKLCDFRPAYGYIFSDILGPYEYWGYCDTDIILGDIRSFISNEILKGYDKIFKRGHLCIYKNTEEIKTLFMKDELYKDVLLDQENRTFDEKYEGGINGIFEKNNFKIFNDDNIIADISIKYSNFIVNNDINSRKFKANSVFFYKNNKLYRKFKHKNEIMIEEVLYLHLQKRRIVNPDLSSTREFIIANNTIYSLDKFNKKLEKELLNKKLNLYRLDYIKYRYNNFKKLFS